MRHGVRSWFGRSASRKRSGGPAPRPVYRPALESLENRLTPTVTSSFLNGTWTLTGDDLDNQVAINSTGPGAFNVTGDPVSGDPAPTGVKKLVINLNGGSDRVLFNTNFNTTPITLNGLTINGGTGNNSVDVYDLTIKGNLTITNLTGFDDLFLENLTVRATRKPGTGNVTIRNGDGGSSTIILARSTTFNSIAKTLTVTNGAGMDSLLLVNTHIGGNVINNNGAGSGYSSIRNNPNALARSTVGGSVTITYGHPAEVDLPDVIVKGNVTINMGVGAGAEIIADLFTTFVPVGVKGTAALTTSGTTSTISVVVAFNQDGPQVGRTLILDRNGPPGTFNLTIL